MLGLFKKKLNVADHLDIINCLIIEEAEQQWNYHAVENNFDKEAFRGSSFAFGVVEMFVTKILKIKADDKDLLYQLFIAAKYLEIMEEKYRDLKGMNEKIMIEGFDSVDFKYKKNAYEIVCEANRMLQLAVKTSKERFKTSEKSNQAYDKYQIVFNKLTATERKELIKNFSNVVADRIEDRNPNNLLD